MCWSQSYIKPTLIQAGTDLTVYKILIKETKSYKVFSFKWFYYFILSLLKINKKIYYISPVMRKFYKLNKRNKDIKLNVEELPLNYGLYGPDYIIKEGYHSFATLSEALKICTGKNYCMMECIIPKGSYYYKNTHLEIVSSNIIIKKELKIKH